MTGVIDVRSHPSNGDLLQNTVANIVAPIKALGMKVKNLTGFDPIVVQVLEGLPMKTKVNIGWPRSFRSGLEDVKEVENQQKQLQHTQLGLYGLDIDPGEV